MSGIFTEKELENINNKIQTDRRCAMNNIWNTDGQFAIVTENADVRLFPSKEARYTTDLRLDRNQQSKIVIGEAVVMDAKTDGDRWCHVIAKDCTGWVEGRYLATCSKGEAYRYVNSRQFIIIKQFMNFCGKNLMPGTKFPISAETDNSYVILIPIRVYGMFSVQESDIPKSDMIHPGYLEYNIENIQEIADNMVGVSYSWGDYGDGIDCSKTIDLIYACVGLYLPRNTYNIRNIPFEKKELSGLTAYEKKDIIAESTLGSLLMTKSHIMLLYGKIENDVYIVHNTVYKYNSCVKVLVDNYCEEIDLVIDMTKLS